jgi:hypothetical protein
LAVNRIFMTLIILKTARARVREPLAVVYHLFLRNLKQTVTLASRRIIHVTRIKLNSLVYLKKRKKTYTTNKTTIQPITQACEDFAATIIIGDRGYTKCRDSKNVHGFYVSCTYFLQFHIYVIS